MTKKAAALTEAKLREQALEVVLPDGVTGLIMVVEHTPGRLIAGSNYPAGEGGVTKYGPAWVIRGREVSKPIALFDTQQEARQFYALLEGPEGELWARREARAARIAQLEAEEAAAAAAAAEEAKERRKLEKSLARKGMSKDEIREAVGGGSSRRSRSSEKPSGSTRMRQRVEEPLLSPGS